MISTRKNKFEFTGTYQEFIERLKEIGFWDTEDQFEEYMIKNRHTNENIFRSYSADFDTRIIDHGEQEVASYPDRTVFIVETEGYTQEEINEAFSKSLHELVNQKERDNSTNKKGWLRQELCVNGESIPVFKLKH